MPTLWVLYEEYGMYSDYHMNIHGVFSSDELGKAAVVEKGAILAGPWVWDGDAWHMTTTGEERWNKKHFTLAPYLMDEYINPDERLAVVMDAVTLSGYAVDPYLKGSRL